MRIFPISGKLGKAPGPPLYIPFWPFVGLEGLFSLFGVRCQGYLFRWSLRLEFWLGDPILDLDVQAGLGTCRCIGCPKGFGLSGPPPRGNF